MSHELAKRHAGRMENYRSRINSAGSRYGVDPAVIAGIISRESRAGSVLRDGWGDHGNAWGLMQVVSVVSVSPVRGPSPDGSLTLQDSNSSVCPVPAGG